MSLALSIGFILMIILPGIATFSANDPDVTLKEKRKLAQFPELNWRLETIESFPKAFDRYIRDNFGFRNKLIKLYNTLQVKWLKQSPVPAVVIGEDGWLFNALEGAISDYYGRNKPTILSLETWRQTLEVRKKWFEQQDIAYFLIIAPNKHSIYSEFLPKSIRQAAGMTRWTKFMAHLEEYKTSPVIDSRQALLAAKTLTNVYHKTDTHWNDYGAFIAAQEIAKQIAGDADIFDSMRPASSGKALTQSSGDLANILGLEDIFNEYAVTFSPDKPCATLVKNPYAIDIPKGGKMEVFQCNQAPIQAKALVIHDSFGRNLKPHLSEYFRETVYINWGGLENYRPVIGPLQPDIVIDERVERNLKIVLVRDANTEKPVFEDKFNTPSKYLFKLEHGSYDQQIEKFTNIKYWLHNDGLALELLGPDATIDINYAQPGKGKTALLKMVVSSSTHSWFSLLYRENSPNGAGIMRRFNAGLNEIYLSIPPQQIAGPIRLVFNDTDYYVIHSLEIIEN